MIAFPNAKINLGLNVIERRTDDFHNIESVMIPIPYCDSLEIVEDKNAEAGTCDLKVLGLPVEGDASDNICHRAYTALTEQFPLPAVKIRLLKNIPMGAGLGGGSSDAAFTIKLLNQQLKLGMTEAEMLKYCESLGSDCSFFVGNETALASSKGEVLEKFELNLGGYHLVLVHPEVHINTTLAYQSIIPDPSKKGELSKALSKPIEFWKDLVINDFESNAFEQYSSLREIKEKLYNKGALYASMTGSGSSMYGIFDQPQDLQQEFKGLGVWSAELT